MQRELHVGASPGFNSALQAVQKVAHSALTVLFVGESGVGKEVFARTLHALSERAGKPFVAVNCAAIPEDLIEAELFGVRKGAFTGATETRAGRFERADGGTLFLDEIACLTWAAQGKLLRALQEREIEPVGDTSARQVDVRVVAATNVDLRAAIAGQRFREDLWFRINVFPVRIPPLRERRADIPLLLDHFLRRAMTRHGKRVDGFTQAALGELLRYHWPGNVRELENMIERAIILCPEGELIDAQHLFTGEEQLDLVPCTAGSRELRLPVSDEFRLPQSAQPFTPDWKAFAEQCLQRRQPLEAVIREIESAFIDAALADARGCRTSAARRLGITYGQIAYHLKQRAHTSHLVPPKV